MTTLANALSWYYIFEGSNLNQEVQAVVQKMDNPATLVDELGNLVPTGERLFPRKMDPLDMAEFYIHAGYAYARFDDWEKADLFFQKAIRLLPDHGHRKGVALWMCGCVGWKLAPDGVKALKNWDDSIHIFRICEQSAIRNLRNDMGEWYVQCLLEMRAAAACHSLEVYKWFAMVQNVELIDVDPGFYESVQQLWDAINQRQTDKAWTLIRQIELGCKMVADPAVTPILLMECGLGAERLGNLDKAVEFYRSAISFFPPEKHWQTVTRWMLGCALWRISGKALAAQQEWVRAIHVFVSLQKGADGANDQPLSEWYRDLLCVIRKALKMAQLGAR